MKTFIVLASFLIFSITPYAASPVKKVLVTNFYFGYHHANGRQLNVALIQQIGKEESFEVEVVNSASEFVPHTLDGAQVLVIQNMTVPDRLGSQIKEAIIEWNAQGGGIFAINATLDGAGGEWDWLIDNCIYGHYMSHSDIVAAEMRIDDEAFDTQGNLHPILKGIENFKGVDLVKRTISGYREEWMNWNNYFRGEENLNILLNMNTESYNCKCTIEDDHPAAWITEPPAPQGALAYSLLGHGGEIHECNTNEYTINDGKGCNQLLKHMWKNTILYLGGEEPTSVSKFSKGQVTHPLSFNPNNLVIYNLEGEKIKELTLPETPHSIQDILDKSTDLSNGIYLVQYTHGERQTLSKIIRN